MHDQVCEAMELLARHEIVHGSLAARNVLVYKFDHNASEQVCVKVCARMKRCMYV